ncbi:MAG TPA: heme ABC transporter ATP-binding protein [Thermoanaerobaculia bacterium]|jgi:iron complex transport system ATP-binding protein
MLDARDIVFRAGGNVLLDRVSAAFEPGRLHLIIGANGAGKSTFVRVLSRLLRPGEGRVTYGEADAAHWSERDLARHRAVLSQAFEVAFPIPVRELVMMGRYPHFRGRPRAADEAVVDEVMQFFDVTDMAERSYGTLSGGERQRVNFARVLAQIWQPLDGASRYLFLDEPLTFLDIRHQIDFMKKVKAFSAQPDVVVVGVVHDLNLAARFADRLLLIHRGRVLADGPTAAVLSRENLEEAFQVTPVLLTNPASGDVLLAFE